MNTVISLLVFGFLTALYTLPAVAAEDETANSLIELAQAKCNSEVDSRFGSIPEEKTFDEASKILADFNSCQVSKRNQTSPNKGGILATEKTPDNVTKIVLVDEDGEIFDVRGR